MAFSQDPFERLTAGATYSRAFNVLAQRYDLFLLISALVYIPLACMMITLMKAVGSSMATILSMADGSLPTDDLDTMDSTFAYSSNTNGNNMDHDYSFEYSISTNSELDANGGAEFEALIGFLGKFAAQLVLEYVAFLVFAIAGQAAMAYAVAEMYAGREPQWLDCLKKGFSRWCALFGAAALITLGMIIGNTLLQIVVSLCIYSQSVLGVLFAVIFYFAYLVVLIYVMVSVMILGPVIMVEGQGPVNSLKRCWELSWHNRCYIFCTLFVVVLILYTVTIILTAIVMEIAKPGFTTFGGFVCSLPMLLYLPLEVILKTVIYLNIRSQLEGLNREVLISDLYGETNSSGKEVNYALIDKTSEV